MLKLRMLLVGLAVLTLLAPALQGVASAQITACTVSAFPNEVPAYSDSGFDFQVSFTGTDMLSWVKITAPNTDFTITDASSDWWMSSFTDKTATFDGFSYDNSLTTTMHVVAHIGDWAPQTAWKVQASSDPGGANPIWCTGSTSLIFDDYTPPVISSVQAVVSQTSTQISWLTDKKTTGSVAFGPTSDYGSTVNAATTGTTHSVTLSSLLPGKAYHYLITAKDLAGNMTTTDDSTFLMPNPTFYEPTPTPSSGGGSTSNQQDSSTTTTTGPVGGLTNTPSVKPAETVPPTVTLQTIVKPIYNSMPSFSGAASDNVAVARVDYSLDGGKNWLAVDKLADAGTPKASYSFTLHEIDDGNYRLQVRAEDAAGNAAVTIVYPFVIDMFPPEVSPAVLSVGATQITPTASGIFRTQAGLDETITVHTLGGATAVAIGLVRGSGQQAETAQFNLTQGQDGLWSGVTSIREQGNYRLVAHAVDGAGNHYDKTVAWLYVAQPSKVINQSFKAVKGAKVQLFSQLSDTHSWQLWDAASYGQTNPVITKDSGRFHYFVPQGTYYLRVSAPGYGTLFSNTITVTEPQSLNATIQLKRGMTLGRLHFGSVSPWNYTNGSLQLTPVLQLASTQKTLPSGELAQFALPKADGGTLHTADLYGKPTVLLFTAGWEPSAAEDLQALAAAGKNPDVNAVAVFEQTNADHVNSFLDSAGLSVPAVADEQGGLLKTYTLPTFPTYVFVNRHGQISQVVSGQLGKDELLNNLGGL